MNKLLPTVIIFLLMISSCTNRSVVTINQREQVNPIRQNISSLYNQREGVWDGTIYSNQADTLYIGKQLLGPPLHATSESLQLSDSLNMLVRSTILESFDQTRKDELKRIGQWFTTNIYINNQGVLKELEFGLPNKVKNKHPEQSIRELDLQRIENNLKGMQLEIPEGWKEAGYAQIVFGIKF